MGRYFGQAQGIVGTVISLAWIAFLWMPWLWDRSADLVHRYGYAGEVKVTIVFCILDSLKDLVLGLPWGTLSVLHCAVLYCAVLYCAVLCCAVLCCAVLCCAVLQCNAMH